VFDTYRAHISKTFESEICNYDNINFVLIPGGMTYLLQPLDVSINKSFKESVKASWKDFMAFKKKEILTICETLTKNPRKVKTPQNAVITQAKIKNMSLRATCKKGLFNEARKRKEPLYDPELRLPKIDVSDVATWIDTALTKLQEKSLMIKKSFKICGISTNLDGSEDHLIYNLDYLKKQLVRSKLAINDS